MTTITRERLLKIQQWRETYGPGSNVVLPAEEAEELARIALASLEDDSDSNNHPAPVPLSDYRLHRIREILGKAAAQSDGGNIGYAMSDAVKVIDEALESIAREQVRREHAAWSQATFGDVGPVGPLKHLSKEALEAAAEPGDLSEWADMQFLLWDAQRRAGIGDEQITQAMVEKLAINKQREWPEPKEGEPRLHIKEQPAAVVPDEMTPQQASRSYGGEVRGYRDGWNACRAAMLNHSGRVTDMVEHVSQPYKLPPHVYRELVNQLHSTVMKYSGCQQLREQISRTLGTVLGPAHSHIK